MKASSDAEVRELYEGSAESYAAMMDSEIELPIYSDTMGRLAERISGVSGPVIDTSCGSGHMLSFYHQRYDPQRALLGVDVSPKMIAIASSKLGSSANVVEGNMRDLGFVESASAAAVLSFFALHHLDAGGARAALREWQRVLKPGGQVLIAAWEGTDTIDYGEESEVVAFRYRSDEVTTWALEAGFAVDRCAVDPVAEIPMDAIYLEGTKPPAPASPDIS